MTTEDTNTQTGLMLTCDNNGTIITLECNNLVFNKNIGSGYSWKEILDPESHEKAGIFFKKIIDNGFTLNWEMNIYYNETITSFHFLGFIKDSKIHIIAALTNIEISNILQELTGISSIQANMLRTALKANYRMKTNVKENSIFYDEIAKLNNELVNLHRKLNKSNIELEKLNTEKNKYIGIAAHDLRNPLKNIILLADIIDEDEYGVSKTQQECISHIKELSKSMLTMVNEILDYSSIESGSIALKMETVNIIQFLQKIIKYNMLHSKKKDIEIVFAPVDKSITIEIDVSKMEQVINNLIANAVKYSFVGTKIYVTIFGKKNDMVISIQDEGQGIKKEEQNLLFTAFQKTSTKPTAGESRTGLGLYIVKRIIDAHKGKIWCESEYSVGSTFYISLPKNKEQSK